MTANRATAELHLVGEVGAISGRRDPLVNALFEKLPAPGASWPDAERKAWLSMMETTFVIVYGAAAGGSMKSASPRAAALPPSKKSAKKAKAAKRKPRPPAPLIPAGPRFYVDRQGYARRAGGDRVLPGEIDDELIDQRGMNGDLATIVWADDSAGIPKGLQINVTIG